MERRRETKGVHLSKTPTHERKSSWLPVFIPTVKQVLADKRCRAGHSYHHPQPQELLPQALQRLRVLSLTQHLPSFPRASRDEGDVTVFILIALQGN